GSPAATAAKPAAPTAASFYAVAENEKLNRLYVFGDTKNYLQYMAHGEVPYTRSRIGAGPGGKSLVFGLTRDDVKAKQSIGELVYDRKLMGGTDFYGEYFKGGRYYVFGDWKDFNDFQQRGEATYTFTEIGTGPKGETIVYGLNQTTVKAGRPVALVKQFQALRGK
ncbi:MAG TPA: hypothetical protein VMN03_13720, partial [Burkholderiales bacterium]|nr:hypothetical protein [Burkholderiales bacterium]